MGLLQVFKLIIFVEIGVASFLTNIKALFASWVLKGKEGEGKTYGEVNPCLRVLKKQGKGFGGFWRASFDQF